jgi:transcriptional regulator with XRE-family HTH domain
VIALGIVRRKTSISGKELRFLRTEMGMTQAALAQVVHREPLTISRWERGEDAIDSNAETLIRVCATQELGLPTDTKVTEISGWCIQGDPAPKPIIIDVPKQLSGKESRINEKPALVGGLFIWGYDDPEHGPIWPVS